MSATAPRADSALAGALALQRVLALEGRDVLSRVELAASELDRFALAPALGERITAIRDAVSELDAVLDKIERLADPKRRERPAGAARLASVLAAIRERIAPALAARGVVLDGPVDGAERAIAIPESVLERLLLLWLRTVIQGLAGDEATGAAQSIELVLEQRALDDAIEIVLRPRTRLRTVRSRIDRAGQTELDVALAEWEARSFQGADGSVAGMGLRLPLVARAGEAGQSDA